MAPNSPLSEEQVFRHVSLWEIVHIQIITADMAEEGYNRACHMILSVWPRFSQNENQWEINKYEYFQSFILLIFYIS